MSLDRLASPLCGCEPGRVWPIVGAGPSGLVTAKHALEAGFDVSVFEESDDVGGPVAHPGAAQRHLARHAHEQSRAMTAGSVARLLRHAPD